MTEKALTRFLSLAVSLYNITTDGVLPSAIPSHGVGIVATRDLEVSLREGPIVFLAIPRRTVFISNGCANPLERRRSAR